MAGNAETDNISNLIAQLSKADLSIQDRETRLRLILLARQLTEALQTPPERAFDICFSFALLPCAYVAADLGVFELIQSAGPQTASELAQSTGADPLLLLRIMRVLAANRMFVELAGPETKFGPTSLSNTFTLPALRNGIKHCFDLGYRGGAGFPSYIRETNHRAVEDELDCPFQYAFQTKLHCFDWWKEHPREASQFHSMMTDYRANRPPWTSMFPMEESICNGAVGKQEVLLVDIGGGFGHDLMLFRDRCPDTKGRLILQDQSDVIDAIPKGSLHPTIEVIKHDFFKPQPIEGARVYFLKHVLHDWPNPKALIILYNLVAVMKDYSKLIIIENVLPEAGPLPVPTAGLDFILMIGFAAMERTKKQWETLLTEAGLKITGQWVKEDGDGVLEVMLA